MERIDLKRADALRALGTLQEIINQPFSVIVRDAAIQRFEYTFEAFWKFTKEYLKEKEGVIANSPKATFRELLTAGLCSEDETVVLLEMTDKRNDTAHTYKEEVAQAIYGQLPQYASLMAKLLDAIKGRM